ncbi:MAG TPA: Slp family lipoprotein [Desulfosalsimonadaceae bacterium]|nr:Slp family lipoprotein [Desulfosalsimonadaceae bacterium]
MNPKNPLFFLLLLLPAALLAACSVVSSDIRRQAADVPFAKIAEDPAAYEGRTVILGGYVAKLENLIDKSRLVVLQAPLDFQDRPGRRRDSRGRFVAVTENFLDPMVYEKGRQVTVAGTISGRSREKVGEYRYAMPVLAAKEIHLWQQWQPRPPYWHHDPYPPWADDYFYLRRHDLFRW